jgi:hypothetical protein
MHRTEGIRIALEKRGTEHHRTYDEEVADVVRRIPIPAGKSAIRMTWALSLRCFAAVSKTTSLDKVWWSMVEPQTRYSSCPVRNWSYVG